MINLKSLSKIPLKPNSLYVIDIDETLIYYKHLPKTWWDKIKELYLPVYDGDIVKTNKKALNVWERIVKNSQPHPVERDIFEKIIKYCLQHNSTILLLTARSDYMDTYTRDHLSIVYPYYNPEIIYCNNENKGIHLEVYLQTTDRVYETIHFVDDKLQNVIDVCAYLHNVNGYNLSI